MKPTATQRTFQRRARLVAALAEQSRAATAAADACTEQARDLGQLLLAECKLALGITQKELAQRCGTSNVYLSSIIHGRRAAGIELLQRVAEVYLQEAQHGRGHSAK